MNYEDMSDNEITWRVHHVHNKVPEEYATICASDYCNNPADAWPIIVGNGISIKHLPKGCNEFATEEWWVAGRRENKTFSKNPLRAAMICFLKMKGASKE